MAMGERHEAALPHLIDGDTPDAEVAALVESWRYRGAHVPWDAIVGHEPQIRRCQEVVEALHRTNEELDRLNIRLGRGLVLSGPAGVGKTLIARAIAGSIGRDVIAPPVAELTPGLIARLYAHLARIEPSVVVLDEAERVVGHGFEIDEDLVRAMCVALDGLERPNRAPITLALTTSSAFGLSTTATRPGRLSPRLELGHPSPEERAVLLERAVAGVPVQGEIAIPVLVERTAGWTGAELSVAIEEAMSRSLLDHTDALTSDNLLAVIAERYVITDPSPRRASMERTIALHEASHALFGFLLWPEDVEYLSLSGIPSTRLRESFVDSLNDVTSYRNLAGFALAGLAGEIVVLGGEMVTSGASRDRGSATDYLLMSGTRRSPSNRTAWKAGWDPTVARNVCAQRNTLGWRRRPPGR
jgi:ATP-dependent Zn protease